MAGCEKCWKEASFRHRVRGEGDSVTEVYNKILDERDGSECSPQEQAGDWWDEDLQMDRRFLVGVGDEEDLDKLHEARERSES